MRKFETSQKDESRAQLADSSKAYKKHRAFYWRLVTTDVLAKSHSHHYPGLVGRFWSRIGLQNNSEIILKLI